MDGIKYQLAVISDQLAVHAGVFFFEQDYRISGLQDLKDLKDLKDRLF